MHDVQSHQMCGDACKAMQHFIRCVACVDVNLNMQCKSNICN